MTTRSSYLLQLGEIWRQAMDPRGQGMAAAIAGELASYTGQTVQEVLDCMARGKEELAELWRRRQVDPADQAQVEAFYRDQFIEAYELADWHCGRTNGRPPLSYAHAAYVARTRGLKRALDFGSGIGTGALCLLQAGCEVECADVANELLKFVAHRVQRRGQHVEAIDLSAGALPRRRYYDLITCFDVLEHVVDPRAKLRELGSYLRPGGYLVVNLMLDSHDPGRPMHVSSAPDWLAWIRQTSLVPEWSLFFDGEGAPVQTFVKRRFGRVRNFLGAVSDRIQRATVAPRVPSRTA